MDSSLLLSLLDLDELASWEAGPKLRRLPEATSLSNVLSIEIVDELISRGGIRYPNLRLVANGVEINHGAYTVTRQMRGHPVDGLVVPEAACRIWREGAVLALQSIQDIWSPVADICRELAAFTGHPVRANCYLAPAHSNGLSLHHDSHDNIIVQVAGRRKWEVYGLYGGRPVPGEKPDFVRDRQQYSEVVRQTEVLVNHSLTPHDIMFIPAGCPHEARTDGVPSLHLTFGIHRAQWRDIALRVTDIAAKSRKFRAALPPKAFGKQFREAAEAAVAELVERLAEIDAVAAAEHLVEFSLPALAGNGSGIFTASFNEEWNGVD